jgi:hypothetical protein
MRIFGRSQISTATLFTIVFGMPLAPFMDVEMRNLYGYLRCQRARLIRLMSADDDA